MTESSSEVTTNLVALDTSQGCIQHVECSPDQETAPPVYAPLPMGFSYRIGFLLASMVAGLSSVCIKQLLLPLQISMIAPHSTNTSFALVSAIGAVAGLLAAPLTGALADLTTSRWGRRRPWILFGVLTGVVGLGIMAWSTTIPQLLIGEILEQIGVDAILSNVTALIPDQVPIQQRATPSALNGMAPVVGGVIGLVLVTTLTNTRIVSQGYVLLAGVSVLCVGFFLLVLHERPVERSQVASFHLRLFAASFVQPLRSRDFVLTLCSRLLVFLSYTLLGSYLLFYLRDIFHTSLEVAARGVTTYQLISMSVLIVVALLAGYISPRIDRLKPFVCVGAVLMAFGVFVIMLFPSWSGLFLAAGLFGGGMGLYLGVDIALVVRVLPNVGSQGKDVGIMYTAIFLPLIVTPILGASILNSFAHAFTLLFAVAAVSNLLAAVLILPIKAVR